MILYFEERCAVQHLREEGHSSGFDGLPNDVMHKPHGGYQVRLCTLRSPYVSTVSTRIATVTRPPCGSCPQREGNNSSFTGQSNGGTADGSSDCFGAGCGSISIMRVIWSPSG